MSLERVKMKAHKCPVVFWKHKDGWDIYRKSDCYLSAFSGEWIPQWFDDAIVEDAKTKKEAVKELSTWHVLGVCLVKG